MTREAMVLEALKREPNPYRFEVQKRVGEDFNMTGYQVGKIAKDHSLILDRVMKENRMKEIESPPESAFSPLIPQLQEIAAQAKTVDIAITDRQHGKEVSDLYRALLTLKEVTPELLESVRNHPKNEFVKSK